MQCTSHMELSDDAIPLVHLPKKVPDPTEREHCCRFLKDGKDQSYQAARGAN